MFNDTFIARHMGFIHYRINHSKEFADRQNHINGIENFWNQAKRVLRKYNGIDRKSFPLFLKECEFRFSARLPVYALIIAAVIPNRTVGGIFNLQGLTLFVLYIAGILSAALAAYIMKRLARMKGNVQQFPLLMELPTFRTPNFKHIMTSLWDRVKAFLKRAGTIIFALAVVLWGLVSWPQPPEGATGVAIDYSLAGTLGHAIQPLFAPLGFTWEMCIAMIPGIAAREVVVAALGTVYAVSASSEDAVQNALIPIIHNNWGLPTAFAFLAWYVYAPMCAATLTVIKRETKSTKNMLMITGYLLLMAYFAAFVVYQISSRILSS